MCVVPVRSTPETRVSAFDNIRASVTAGEAGTRVRLVTKAGYATDMVSRCAFEDRLQRCQAPRAHTCRLFVLGAPRLCVSL